MSLQDVDVQAKKDPTAVVHWNEYEALRDTLQRKITTVIDPIDDELQHVGVQVDGVAATAEATQTQVTALQTSMELRTLFDRQLAVDDDHSVNGDDEHAAVGQGDNQEQLGRGGG